MKQGFSLPTPKTLALLFFLGTWVSGCNTPGPTSTGNSPTPPQGTQVVEAVSPTSTATQLTTSPEEAPPTMPAPTPSADNPHFFGIEMRRKNFKQRLEASLPMGAAWVRRNGVRWSKVEPQEGERKWGSMKQLENELKSISESGLETILIVRSTPPWAQAVEGTFCGPIKAEKLPAFGDFMFDLVSRYSQPPFNVKYWEIWNEPDVDPSLRPPESAFGCWGDMGDPYYGGRYYGEMLKAVYPRIKEADPQAQVLVGGLLLDCDPRNPPEGKDCLPTRFLEGILLNGGGDFFDGVSFHAYDYYGGELGLFGNGGWHSSTATGPVVSAKTDFIRETLANYGVSGKFLMNTESALLCDQCTDDPAFEATKAVYLVQTYTTAHVLGLRTNIWYNLQGWRNSGLVNADLQPLPAYLAYAFASQQFDGARFMREISDYPGVRGYEFQGGEGNFWVVWSLDGQPHPLNLSVPPLAVFDFLGNPQPAGNPVTVDLLPLYLEWAP